jgi:hypothetical protein
VYRYGRNGKANIVIAAAVVVLLVAVGLFVFLGPKGSETPAESVRVMESDAEVLTAAMLWPLHQRTGTYSCGGCRADV